MLEKKKFFAIGAVINKIRIVQGWNMISPKDAEPIARVWLEQLDRYNIAPELYEMLLNRCIDRRASVLKESGQPPALTVELFLAEFDKYKSEIKTKFYDLANLRYLKNELFCAKEVIKPFEYQPPRDYPETDHRFRITPKSEEEQRRAYESRILVTKLSLDRQGKYQSIEEMIEKTAAEIERRAVAAEKLWKESFIQEPMPRIDQ